MKLTGKQLFEWWEDAVSGSRPVFSWDATGPSAKKAWDALAEKLNGMMEREGRVPIFCLKDSYCTLKDGHAGDCDLSISRDLAESFRERHNPLFDQMVANVALVGKASLIFTDEDRARHHATCPYRHGKGDCTCGPSAIMGPSLLRPAVTLKASKP